MTITRTEAVTLVMLWCAAMLQAFLFGVICGLWKGVGL